MPISFPDSESFPESGSLINAAEVHRFRKPSNGESQDAFREALADHVESIDFVESCEIRNKVGWDKFSDSQNRAMLRRKGFNL